MTKQEYLKAIHEVYKIIYAKYGDKEIYAFKEGMEIVNLSLQSFPEVFNIDQTKYNNAMPEITKKSQGIVKDGMSIDELLTGVSIFVLQYTGKVTRFFPIKILFWSLLSPLRIAPAK